MANKACNEVVTVANMPMTVFDMISAMQNKYADRVAFRYVEGKDTVVEKTYAQYVQDIRKATGYLQQELGEPKGKKIVILSRTNYEYGAVVFGTMMAGAVIVTLNQGKTWAELEYELGMVEPDLIFNDGIDYGYRAQLEALYGFRIPDTQGVYNAIAITHDGEIKRNRLNGLIALLDEVVAVVFLIVLHTHITAEFYLFGVLRTAKLEGVAVFQPVIRHLYLITVFNFLFEHSVTVTDATAISCIV